ncbi:MULTISPECIES: FAD-dependent oxidoreductase [Streptomyces]|uniref:D-amino-acid oxidase n=1 Tax=Streptomyces stelliscabiei TaxID=146820 RepID=A0A8I0PCX7_9ACTN|nr:MULTISPECIES: FAD-dependent oxidoreductase [Streptomyces]KND44632.1 amino acid oxidase [Streptomyces stelliscabiei]MBE1601712.1 D-amino-acid oxidase [Streptomyces stelliscabiei]MDX2514979.1 FAD-dependent oxidoreductase [Streptomyces stelliscabiei]MDX2555329.1 FAD-dependent oxidoreductase [Streptomyces stelliscabiei]MDX2613018.1 FAD-dependent oxidoreductase [Streptomyces stelliscabiei]
MTKESNSDVIVVGGGVVGLTTAVVLAEGGRRVRIWTREPAELTTSAVAGGLWWPYRIEPEELVGAWALVTLAVYEELTARSGETGVRMVEGVHGETELDGLGAWASRVRGLRVATAGEYAGVGLWARLPLIDMPVHLRWLRERFAAAGGVVEERTVTDLAAVDAPVVVNCTGLGARQLVPDPSVRPVRGQLVVVENPGVTTWLTSVDHGGSESTYFIPQPGGLILGGTAEEDAWSLTPDPVIAREIVRRCAAIRPEIEGARVIEHRVGLRPARPAVRLEREVLPGGRVLVHNYGHGGAGVTVAWGCAREAARLASG